MKFLLFFLFPIQLFAQAVPENKVLTGVWAGSLYNDTTKQYIPYELAITESGGKLEGYSHIIFVIDSAKDFGVKTMKIKRKQGKLFIEDRKLIDNNYATPPAKGVRTFMELIYTDNDSIQILTGMWRTNRTREFNSLTGSVRLTKKKHVWQTLIVPKLDQMGLSSQLSFLTNTIRPATAAAFSKKSIDKPIPKPSTGLPVDAKVIPEEIRPDTTILNPELVVMVYLNKDKKDKKPNEASAALMGKNQEKKVVAKRIMTDSSIALKNKIEDTKKQEIENRGLTKETSEKVKNVVKEEKLNVITPDKKSGLPPKNQKNQVAKTQHIKNKKVAKETSEKVKKDVEDVKLIALAPNKEMDSGKADKKELQPPVTKNEDSHERVISKNEEANKISDSSLMAKAIAKKISNRKIETIRTVGIVQDSLVLSLYDNGAVDGDTISVFVNGKLVISKVRLLAKGYNKTIHLTPEMGDSIQIIMYAENLGEIAPNTGLLVIRDGDINYEIRFSGDLKRNSAIILKRKRK